MAANINLRELRMGIKRGITAGDFVKKWGLQSEEELFQWIRKNADKSQKEIISDLKQNEKCKHKTAKKVTMVHEPEETKVLEDKQDVTEDMLEDAEPEISEVTKPNVSLETLLAEEEKLSQEVCDLEGSHKELMHRRRTIMANLQNIKRESEKILESLKNLKAEAQRLKQEYDETAEKMRSTSSDISVLKEVLEELRAQIEEAKMITILVYSDGNIDIEAEGVEAPTFVSPSEEEQSITLTSLIIRPDAEELTIKELKAMARLLPILKQLGEIKYEIVFDNSKLEDFYQNIVATATTAESA